MLTATVSKPYTPQDVYSLYQLGRERLQLDGGKIFSSLPLPRLPYTRDQMQYNESWNHVTDVLHNHAIVLHRHAGGSHVKKKKLTEPAGN